MPALYRPSLYGTSTQSGHILIFDKACLVLNIDLSEMPNKCMCTGIHQQITKKPQNKVKVCGSIWIFQRWFSYGSESVSGYWHI